MADINLVKRRNTGAALISGLVASAISGFVLMLMGSLALVPEFDFVLIQGSIFNLAGTAIAAWSVYFFIGIRTKPSRQNFRSKRSAFRINNLAHHHASFYASCRSWCVFKTIWIHRRRFDFNRRFNIR